MKDSEKIELAKSILESEGYLCIPKNKAYFYESYLGLCIAPFKEFTQEDYYAFAGAHNINGEKPLIYAGNTCSVLITGDEDEPQKCILGVYFEEEGYYTESLSFLEALDLARKVVSMEGNSDRLLGWLEGKSLLQCLLTCLISK